MSLLPLPSIACASTLGLELVAIFARSLCDAVTGQWQATRALKRLSTTEGVWVTLSAARVLSLFLPPISLCVLIK